MFLEYDAMYSDSLDLETKRLALDVIISNCFLLASAIMGSVSRPISVCTCQLRCVTGQRGNI